jgi:hypothetical protein
MSDDDLRLRRYLESGEDLDALTQETLRKLRITIDIQFEKQIRHFVLAEGSAFSTQPFPESFKDQSRGECFIQSILLSINAELRYVEGYALAPDGTLANRHAWCVDAAGGIVDCTWQNAGLAYFGFQFPSEYVDRRWAELRGSFDVREYSLLPEYYKNQRETPAIARSGSSTVDTSRRPS